MTTIPEAHPSPKGPPSPATAPENVFDQKVATLAKRIPENYTLQQFADITGLPFEAVLSECLSGKLETYPMPGLGSWMIAAHEADRYLPTP